MSGKDYSVPRLLGPRGRRALRSNSFHKNQGCFTKSLYGSESIQQVSVKELTLRLTRGGMGMGREVKHLPHGEDPFAD